MANNIVSVLTVKGDEELVKELFESVRGTAPAEEDEDNTSYLFDFNRIVPMSERLMIDAPANEEAVAYLHATLKLARERTSRDKELIARADADPELKAALVKCAKDIADNVCDYGYPTWYEWRWSNWGTKWNSYENERIDENHIKLTTAWEAPLPIFKALSAKFPALTLEVEYADADDLFSKCGYVIYRNGEEIHRELAKFNERAVGIVDDVLPEYSGMFIWSPVKKKIVEHDLNDCL